MYTFENGLRKVAPYFSEFSVRIKQRWEGKTLIELQTTEFGELAAVVEQAIRHHRLFIETNQGKKKHTQQTIKGWDLLATRPLDRFDVIHSLQHRHEPSVGDLPWSVIHEDDDLLVISKPPGIPTHPTGNYHYNSITEIVKFDRQLANVWPTHRLDKATAGVLILAKNQKAGKYYQQLFSENKQLVTKEYFARVRGEFPQGTHLVNCPIFSVMSTQGHIRPVNADELMANSSTIFTRVSYDPTLDQSVVKCQPVTGKTHQIRIHLRNVGFPIANDYLYNPVNEGFINHEVNKLSCSIELELYRRLFRVHPEFGQLQLADKLPEALQKGTIDLYSITNWYHDSALRSEVERLKSLRSQLFEKLKADYDTKCLECGKQLLTTDRDLSDQAIWLHAFKYHYQGNPDICFEDDVPLWAKPNFID